MSGENQWQARQQRLFDPGTLPAAAENEHDIVQVLVRVAQEAPSPWYFRERLTDSRDDQWRLEQFLEILEYLHREGLVERRDDAPHRGPGVLITEKGKQALADPQMRARLPYGE